MLTIYNNDYRLHRDRHELVGGQFTLCFEKPSHTDMVFDRVEAVGLGEVRAPRDFDLEPVRRTHSESFVHFLQNAWQDWLATGRSRDILPIVWSARRLRWAEPDSIDGCLDYCSSDVDVPVTAGIWQAITSSANVALNGQSELANDARSVSSSCRLSGHRATVDRIGGYCFFNNAAIVAQAFLDQGAERVTVLDVDYHHSSDTQDIFYDRADVLFISIHGDPRLEYPYLPGYVNEKGNSVGTGYNFSYLLVVGSDWATWNQALQAAIRQIQAYTADILITSLGVDAFKEDPISQFRLDSPDYLYMGEAIGKLGLATLFVMEGGYAVEEIGINAVNVLQGLEGVHR